ncbi:MAG: GNAT family N-acetyltransferase [Clostridia bacterium]|nr:GNAT family N-acetyltransferase [Clostridia bacterium]
MKFKHQPKIATKRLVLREIVESHFDNLIDIFMSEEVKKTFMLPDFSVKEEALKLARRFRDLSSDYNRFVYGICLDNRLIGFVNDVFIGKNEVELGYVIHPSFKNKGFATETLSACIDLIFQSGFKTVKAGAFEENFASQRVMQKCGMTLTGEEEQIEYRGEIHRCVYYQKRQT